MQRTYLITGGAGFIGANAANRLLERGDRVVIYDNLSRPGAQLNLSWLRRRHGDDSFVLVVGDMRDPVLLAEVVRCADVILHLAGQVAVTTSVRAPREDFEINAAGTFNLLEAARVGGRDPIVIYASTNKVYGGMSDLRLTEGPTRYAYTDLARGVDENRSLDFHSPYGCSKGCGDQYVHDYCRIYGLRGVVFRQSCIYGPRQFGVEDQGWVAWLMIAAVTGRPIVIYGDGKQVRDLLWIDDLLAAYDQAVAHIDRVAGKVYNLGGGADNTLSVWREYGPRLQGLVGHEIGVHFEPWRPGDQRVYVSDVAAATRDLEWRPTVAVPDGLERLFRWVRDNRELFEALG